MSMIAILGATFSRRGLLARNASRNLIARTMSGSDDEKVVRKDEVVRFVEECLQKVGTSPQNAYIVGHHLMTSDYRGHFSHGLARTRMYVQDIMDKLTDPNRPPEIVNDFQAIALVDGKHALGQVIGKYCMELAIEKAKKFGIGMVAARNSNHFGICGYYTLMAMEKDLIGLTCTNASPFIAPTRSARAALGTNPISLAMAANDGDQYVLDMATSAVAYGKVELAFRKGTDIPEGWALGADGKPTRNAKEALDNAVLLPLGGTELNSGYKGYSLAVMVEVLCGVLSGSHFGPNIRLWNADRRIANLGQCFMAIDPAMFSSGSKERLSILLRQLRNMPAADEKPVLVAGDPEREHMKKVDREGGIAYHPSQLKASKELAEFVGVRPMSVISKSA